MRFLHGRHFLLLLYPRNEEPDGHRVARPWHEQSDHRVRTTCVHGAPCDGQGMPTAASGFSPLNIAALAGPSTLVMSDSSRSLPITALPLLSFQHVSHRRASRTVTHLTWALVSILLTTWAARSCGGLRGHGLSPVIATTVPNLYFPARRALAQSTVIGLDICGALGKYQCAAWIHPDRVAGRDRNHRGIDRTLLPRRPVGS